MLENLIWRGAWCPLNSRDIRIFSCTGGWKPVIYWRDRTQFMMLRMWAITCSKTFWGWKKIEKIRWNRYKYQILKPFQIWQISNPLKVPFSLKFVVSNLLKTRFTSLFINTAGSTGIHNRTAKVPWSHLLFYSHAIVTADVTYCRFRGIDHH